MMYYNCILDFNGIHFKWLLLQIEFKDTDFALDNSILLVSLLKDK